MEDAARFHGTIPELYDRYLGPVIFEPYAVDLARRIAAAAPRKLLEVACGTGISTARLRAAVPNAEMTATDLNDAMIARAANRGCRPTSRGERPMPWRCRSTTRPSTRSRASSATCTCPDKAKAFAEARCVLSRRRPCRVQLLG